MPINLTLAEGAVHVEDSLLSTNILDRHTLSYTCECACKLYVFLHVYKLYVVLHVYSSMIPLKNSDLYKAKTNLNRPPSLYILYHSHKSGTWNSEGTPIINISNVVCFGGFIKKCQGQDDSAPFAITFRNVIMSTGLFQSRLSSFDQVIRPTRRISVNQEKQRTSTTKGRKYYVHITRTLNKIRPFPSPSDRILIY